MVPKFLLFLSLSILFFDSVILSQQQQKNEDSKSLKVSENLYNSSQIYVFGGDSTYNTLISSASHFNSSSGEWDSISDLSIPKDFMCGAVVGTNIYLFGGRNAQFHPVKTVEVYDCETDTYSPYRSLPLPRWGCAAAVLNGYIYVAGGATESPEGKRTDVIRYNIQTTRREKVNQMHTARDRFQLVELAGKLYAIGGGTNAVEVYNPATGQWLSAASTHFEHSEFGATAHEGKIYVCSSSGTEVFSPDTGEWEVLPTLDGYWGKSLVSMNGLLWAIGGSGTKSVHTFSPATKHWSQQLDMDVPRQWDTAFVVNH